MKLSLLRPFLAFTFLLLFTGHLTAAPAKPGFFCPMPPIDDFEDASRDGQLPYRNNLWGGRWQPTKYGGSSIAVSYTAPGHSSTRSAGAKGTTSGGTDWAIFQCPIYDWNVPYNAACHGMVGVQFWLKGDGKTYRVEVMSAPVTDNNYYGKEVYSYDDDWKFFQVAFEDMTRSPGWGTQPDLPQNPDGTNVTGFQIFPKERGDFIYSLDDVSFYGSCKPDCPGEAPPAEKGPEGTPTPTPGGVAVPTAIPFASNCPPKMIDDFDDSGRNATAPARTNLFGGKWTTAYPADRTFTVKYADPGAYGGGSCAVVEGKSGWNAMEARTSFKTTIFSNGKPYNATAEGFNGVQFDIKGDGNSYWVNLLSSEIAETTGYSYKITPPPGKWIAIRIPFNRMNKMSWWNDKQGSPSPPTGCNITGVEFMSEIKDSFSFSVDQISFYCSSRDPLPVCPSPVIVPTLAPTPIVPVVLKPTSTPIPIPPTRTPIPIPTPTPFKIPTRVIPVFAKTSTPRAVPTRTPLPIKPTPIFRKVLPKPTLIPHSSLLTPNWVITPTPKRVPIVRSVVAVPTAVPAIPDGLPAYDPYQVITFEKPPANIFVTLADGAGMYRVEVVDGNGKNPRVLFEQRVVAKRDVWLEWDGTDGNGGDARPGQYFVVIYKDGKALKSISMIRIAPRP